MTPEEIEGFLAEPRLAHLATVAPDGRPRTRPVWFVWADGAMWFTTRLESRFIGTDIQAGSALAASIASEDRPYRAVLLRGTAEVWEEDREAWLLRISTRYGRAEGERWVRGALKEADRVVIRLVPTSTVSWDFGKGDRTPANAGRRR